MRDPRRSLAGWRAGAGIVVLGALAAACSSTPSAAPPPTSHQRTAATTTSVTASTTTTSPPATTTSVTAAPEQTASLQVQIAGATAIISFDSSDLSGTLATSGARFSPSGTAFDFVITGVSYSGFPVTTNAPSSSGLISQVTVSSSAGGVTVVVSLRSPASHDEFGIGHDTVGVSLS
jgi:hypothetical protein